MEFAETQEEENAMSVGDLLEKAARDVFQE